MSNSQDYKNLDYAEDFKSERPNQDMELSALESTLQNLKRDVESHHNSASFALLIMGIFISTAWAICWAIYRKSPSEGARSKARISGILFIVVLLLWLAVTAVVSFSYGIVIGIIGATNAKG